MISEHMNFRHTISVVGILSWEFLVVKFQSRKTGKGNLGQEISVPHIPFEGNPSEQVEEWIEYVKHICSQYDNIPPASAG